ncbi:SMI1/KNR4 family protein [Tenacibaculum dicentrarchi]|nr:SMI1/KNR4 family protein [Tenacibaculum dicentrarchi]MCD8421221.1 SMI1/KNR4 family protein [Tenacibaculum dicentrarchi]MCD8452736.1 SMI1/KNR4 family protein [Tenacibaculum dicentrarchi]
MNIPKEIEEFILKKVELENFCLPHFYPTLNSLEDFQIGYKSNGNTGEKITGEKKGDFIKNWFVICSGYANDPFFIDIKEENENFPIYFAWHGTGSWKPIKVSENISEFSKQLDFLKNLELSEKDNQSELKTNFDLNNEFWNEVYNEYEDE